MAVLLKLKYLYRERYDKYYFMLVDYLHYANYFLSSISFVPLDQLMVNRSCIIIFPILKIKKDVEGMNYARTQLVGVSYTGKLTRLPDFSPFALFVILCSCMVFWNQIILHSQNVLKYVELNFTLKIVKLFLIRMNILGVLIHFLKFW